VGKVKDHSARLPTLPDCAEYSSKKREGFKNLPVYTTTCFSGSIAFQKIGVQTLVWQNQK